MVVIGLDLGTSGAKAVALDDSGVIQAQAMAPLFVSRPQPLWSEQDPQDWIAATRTAIRSLPDTVRRRTRAIGLSGQMHGATLLDAEDKPLRPAILWNDGRSGRECIALEAAAPDLVAITGNRAMPGFTAPKLAWVRAHEPEIFAATRRVLLPKDYVRLWLTGEAVSDMSDSAGTLWLDVERRDWSDALLSATGLTRDHMPRLIEGSSVSGVLRPEAAEALGLPQVPVAGGGGDNAASAVGIGAVAPGQAFVSVGTSGVIFVADDAFRPEPQRGVHTFCHALPKTWHRMSVTLSAASAIDSVARLAGFSSTAEAVANLGEGQPDDPLFAPWLSGERTPHNDPSASGVFVGLTHATTREALVRAALEGVAFSLADGFEALGSPQVEALTVVGGGTRITGLGPLLAAALGRPLVYRDGGETAAALGAARLAWMALEGEVAAPLRRPGQVLRELTPDEDLAGRLAPRRAVWRRLHPALSQTFQELSP
ncbi:MAG: xylulokinase [Phenylobacterium sp.]|uniref:xylulokinase n=1 Tax=Phenylobacterium sp. TaxID=1871053 RepID=UPI0025DE0475|nr:xylulokinase [Phenylobacterium sp.]MCA6243757.1 xylulokinase [Phenylobacterium sp.]